MLGNEAAAARQYGAAPIMIISDNAMYGTIGMHSYVRYPERPFMAGTRPTHPPFSPWGRSLGAGGGTLKNDSHIPPRTSRAFPLQHPPPARPRPPFSIPAT